MEDDSTTSEDPHMNHPALDSLLAILIVNYPGYRCDVHLINLYRRDPSVA